MLHVIESLSIQPGPKLHVKFADGREGTVDLEELIRSGGVFDRLRDPNFLEAVRIGKARRYVGWPGEIDLCADALWLQIGESTGQSARASKSGAN